MSQQRLWFLVCKSSVISKSGFPDVVAIFDAYKDAIVRVLGAPSRLLHRLDAGTVREALVVKDEVKKR